MTDILKRNRALAYLKTKQFDAALSDTGYPTLDLQSPEKALFRATEALYYLRSFDECLTISKLVASAYPDNQQASDVLQRTEKRVEEQKTGVYDWAKLQKLVPKLQPPHLDLATYIGPVEVKQTQSKGRGLFVTADVKAGDLLICEKAFSHAFVAEGGASMTLLMHPETNRASLGGQADLVKNIVRKLQLNPSLAPDFNTLYHGDYQTVGIDKIDSQPVVDT
jgi:hypothetical protein